MTKLVQNLPQMPSVESGPMSSEDSSTTTPLLFSSNNMPNLNHLNKDFVANFGLLVPDNYQVQSEGQPSPSDQPVNQVQSEGQPSPSDQVVNLQTSAVFTATGQVS